jgi:hypothetical protein
MIDRHYKTIDRSITLVKVNIPGNLLLVWKIHFNYGEGGGDIAIEISPSNNQNSHVAYRDKDVNLENKSSASSFQVRVYRADVLRKSWTKQGLIVVFTGLIVMNILWVAAWLTIIDRLLLCTLAINFADSSTQVYAASTTSAAALYHECGPGSDEYCAHLCISLRW